MYLRETNRKVSTFRTFANPSETVRVLDHFVAPRFTPASTKSPVLDMDELLEGITRGSKTIISGFAGYGKSMAMRFIALSLFENPRGRVPIFLELRNLNRLETPNLVAYINSTPSLSIDFPLLHEFLEKNWDDLPFLFERNYSFGEEIEVVERTFSFDALPPEILEESRLIEFAKQEYRNLKKLHSNLIKSRRHKENFLDRLLIEDHESPKLN